MSAEAGSDLQLEIGHVLFMDMVGYSRLLVDQQHELQRGLTEIVQSTEQVCLAEAAGKLIRIRVGANDRPSAEAAVNQMCEKLLANPVIETFEFTLSDATVSAHTSTSSV